MRLVRFIILSLLFLLLSQSCSKKAEDMQVLTILSSWDSMIDSMPQLISDSLEMIQQDKLNRSNRAYYNLLKVISDDKTYVNFTSDSLINTVTSYYITYDPRNPNLIRSLAYQGIVRTRMGIRDSTVYEPLREADRLLNSMSERDPRLGYLINYFLGNINHNSRNYTSANQHFLRTLSFAHEEKDSVHLFDSFLALYWSEMQQRNIEKGKSYLDSLSQFYNQLPFKNYFILNSQSFYYDVVDDPLTALDIEKAKLLLHSVQDENVEISRVYYNISNRYVGLELLDSAMLYAQMAIDIIEDTSYVYNHMYFENIANIAERQNNFSYANNYRKIASASYKNTISGRLDTQIAELEKRYDLTESENELLRAHQQILRIVIGALILIIVLIIILLYARKIRRITQSRLLLTENKIKQQELQAALMKEEEGKRKWLLLLYSNISDRLTFLQGEFEKLTQRYVSTQPKVYKDMQKILKNTDTDLRDINKTLSPDEKTFFSYTHLNDDKGILNSNEKMILMLLSCDADNRQLATFMNTTIESVRVRKSQLKKKMSENAFDVSIFND